LILTTEIFCHALFSVTDVCAASHEQLFSTVAVHQQLMTDGTPTSSMRHAYGLHSQPSGMSISNLSSLK